MPLDPLSTAALTTAVICAATAAGMFLPRRRLWLATAAALIFMTTVTEVLPDAWHEAVEDHVPAVRVVAAVVLGFAVITYLTRHDHGSRHRGEHSPGRHRGGADAGLAFGGFGTALALASHRTFESTAVATTATTLVLLTLLIHSVGEGVTLGALLHTARRHPAPWLVLACTAPLAGGLIAFTMPPPEPVVPLLLALAAGELLHTALLALKLLGHGGHRPSPLHLTTAAALALVVGVPLLLAHPTATAPGPPTSVRVTLDRPDYPVPPLRPLHAPARHHRHRPGRRRRGRRHAEPAGAPTTGAPGDRRRRRGRRR